MVAQAPDGGALVDVVSALMARATERLTIGWGIISPCTRHPVQVAMEARVVQEAAGPGRFLLGFGTSKIFLNNARTRRSGRSGRCARRSRSCAACSAGEASPTRANWSADVPPLAPRRGDAARRPPVYVAATAPKMQALAGEIARGLPDALDHDARVRPLHARERRRGHRHRLHRRRLDRRGPRRRPGRSA